MFIVGHSTILLWILYPLLATAFRALPKLERRGPVCTDFKIPVTASAPTRILSSPPVNLANPTVFVDYLTSQAGAAAGIVLGAAGTQLTSGTYNIAMRYCAPEVYNASRANTIQYLQHAITNTKDYWNGLTFPNGYMGNLYSWIAYASSQGYPTLSVDNLGSGASDRPNGLLITQQTLQVEIIHQIITMLRHGAIPNPVLSGKQFNKVIYAGHSYGSICGNAIATHHPEDIDAFIYTGYSGDFIGGLGPLSAGVAIPAALAMPLRYGYLALQPLYLAQSVEEGRRIALYTNVGGYDPNIVHYDFVNEGTVAVGELVTLFYGLRSADDFQGDILVITGKQDAICCNRVPMPDCGSGPSSIPEQARAFFPAARNYTTYIPDKTGHSPNLHDSAPRSFVVAHEYLAARGY